eukprot:GFUD01007975.1.p1 GENE.GFUD01007975.1~~GFUD01007975.1.p1  ORF type:complete len:1381 (+),score=430.56 GFUD01007975.1:102-4244(+)
MKEVFESEEFLNFEKFCNARKISFVVSVTKFSSVNKPKKGPVYVMSDFFVYDIPEDWERMAIRVTPHSTWLNPKALPALSHPLSKLLTMPSEIKENFIEMWNHIHGVMAESYFCPKLYLTRIPRVEVEKFMDPSQLPPGSHLSCCDLVYFPVFVKWLKSPITEDKINGHTRIRFVALLIHLAYQLYQLNPETHVEAKGEAARLEVSSNVEVPEKAVEKEEEIEILSPGKPQPKTPDKVGVEEDIEILTPENPQPEMTSSSVQTPVINKPRNNPDKRPPMVSIASDIVQALDEIEILTPKKHSGAQSPNVKKSAVSQSHDSNSLDEVTEIEILTPSKMKPDKELKPIDYIDLDIVDDEASSASAVQINPSLPSGLNSMVFTKSSASGQTSTVQQYPKVEEVVKTKQKSSLQLRKDLWGEPAEVVDITDDISCDEDVNASIESCSRTSPVKVKSREELKSMLWGKEEDAGQKGNKDRVNGKKDDNPPKDNKVKESGIIDSKLTESNSVIIINESSDRSKEIPLDESSKKNSKNGDVIREPNAGSKDVVDKTEDVGNKVDKCTSQSNTSDVIKMNLVSNSLGKLIQVCIKLLPKNEFTMFSRKVSKYLNNIPEEHMTSIELVNFIDNKCSVIKSDVKNKYVHMKEVFDEMKKFRQSGSVSETSEPSNNDRQKNPVIDTAMDDKENIPRKQNDLISLETSKNDTILMEVDPPMVNPDQKKISPAGKTSGNINHIVDTACPDKHGEEVSSGKASEKKCVAQDLASAELTKNLSLKEVLQSFLEKCRKSLAAKTFQPYFKQILKYMNNLDPAHLNSLPLKVFVHEHSQQENESQDIISHIDAVISEIQKYQKSTKRALPSDEGPTQAPPKKKVCLTTISNKVPLKKGSEPVIKVINDLTKSQSREANDSLITDTFSNGPIDIEKKSKSDTAVKFDALDKDSKLRSLTAAPEDMDTTSSSGDPDRQEKDKTDSDSAVNPSPADIFLSLGLRPKNCPGESKSNIVKEKEAKTTILEEEKLKTAEIEKPSSSKQCFNENLVHEKDKKTKKKVSAQHLDKLEKALKKCAKEIKRLEEAEVDWDDDGDSNYILCAKYKRRYMDLFNKIANYKELSSNLDRKVEKKFFCTESRYPEINKKIQKFVNRTKEFPDFQDVKKLVKEANSTLHLNSLQMHDEAENIFQSVGKKLKKRREHDDTDVMVSYLKEDQMVDPASKNEELDKILIVQAAEGKKNINKYFDDFYSTHVINAKAADTDTVESGKDQKDEVSDEAESSGKNPVSSEGEDKTEAGTAKCNGKDGSACEGASTDVHETPSAAAGKVDVQINVENKVESEAEKSASVDKETESVHQNGSTEMESSPCGTTGKEKELGHAVTGESESKASEDDSIKKA